MCSDEWMQATRFYLGKFAVFLWSARNHNKIMNVEIQNLVEAGIATRTAVF